MCRFKRVQIDRSVKYDALLPIWQQQRFHSWCGCPVMSWPCRKRHWEFLFILFPLLLNFKLKPLFTCVKTRESIVRYHEQLLCFQYISSESLKIRSCSWMLQRLSWTISSKECSSCCKVIAAVLLISDMMLLCIYKIFCSVRASTRYRELIPRTLIKLISSTAQKEEKTLNRS